MITKHRNARLLTWLGIAVSIAGFWLWKSLFGPPAVADEWSYQVWRTNLPSVSALSFDHQGGLYATLELTKGRGKLLHLPRSGEITELLSGMNKPDGMAQWDATLYITNESAKQPIIVFSEDQSSVIEGIDGAEGIDIVDGKELIVIEDRKPGGRLIRIDLAVNEIEVLLEGLQAGEGVCQDTQGSINFVEKSKGTLQKYVQGKRSTLYSGLHNPAFLNCLKDGSILITEDRTNFGRLLHYKHGEMTEIASRLRSPQSAIQDSSGAIYLAEQRRNRILKFSRKH